MRTFKMVEEILAAPDIVFAVLCDVERWPNWTPTMTRVKRLEGGIFGLKRSCQKEMFSAHVSLAKSPLFRSTLQC